MRLAMRPQVGGIATVGDVAHHHVESRHRETGLVDARPSPQQFDQRERVFPARKSDEYPVALFNEAVLHHALGKTPLDAAQRLFFFRKFRHTML
ncbi:hypothetical protein GGR07_000170 [Bacteroides pyogenes]|nr:hypothetical protein [Bacteroides pyogenes]